MKTFSDTGTAYALLAAPALTAIIFFYLVPTAYLLLQSLYDPDLTFRHFERIFATPIYLRILGRTFMTALDVSILTLLIGYPIAYIMANRPGLQTNLLLLVVLLPFWTSVLIRSYAWILLLHRGGVINHALLGTGLISEPLPLVYNSFGVHVGLVYVSLPVMILPLYAALSNIPANLSAAAAVLGSKPTYTFFRVVLPLSLPGVYSGMALVFVWNLGAFLTPALLGGMREVLMTGVIDNVVRTTLNWGFASALSTVLIVATLGTMLLLHRFAGTLHIGESR
jgi:ABC-type spermidine/putrescine transport system permease subunit I